VKNHEQQGRELKAGIDVGSAGQVEYTQPERAASQREVDQLRGDIRRLDEHGTRGVQALLVQLTEVVKDMSEMKSEVNARFDAHQRIHDQDHKERQEGRRWFFMAAVTFIGVMAAVIGLLVDIAGKLHGLG
jgi:hypothetical protein